MAIIIILFVFCSVCLLVMAIFPAVVNKLLFWKKKKEEVVERELDKAFATYKTSYIIRLYFILPVIFGGAGLFIFNSVLLCIGGVLLGLFIPNLILKRQERIRKKKFSAQLLDAIMIMSSSLKGGLSLLQAIEVLAEEMPAPMSQEMAWVFKENRVGVSLDESLEHLNQRMQLEELELMVNSILVARETGGDIIKVFSRLSTTIRDRNKLKQNIQTLTLQGRLQGMIMSVIPFFFTWWVLTFNRAHFNIMFQDSTGRLLLVLAVILQIVGMVLIKKFSTIRI